MSIVTVTLNPCIDKTVSVEQVLPDCKLACTLLQEYPGGGGINVARVLGRLGIPVNAYWSCGGEVGQRLQKFLDEENVRHTPIPIRESVRENLIVRESCSGSLFRFGMPGPELRDVESQQWLQQVREIPSTVEYLVVSGSLPGGASLEWYGDLLREVPDGIRVVVDTKQAALQEALRVGVYLIKPNVRELQELVGRELPNDAAIEQAAQDIVAQRGAEVVLVSLGRAGVLLATKEMIQRIHAPSVPLRSKVGAGDAVVGGLVAGLSQGRSLLEATRFGVAAGAAAVMTEGTELCRTADVEQLFQSL